MLKLLELWLSSDYKTSKQVLKKRVRGPTFLWVNNLSWATHFCSVVWKYFLIFFCVSRLTPAQSILYLHSSIFKIDSCLFILIFFQRALPVRIKRYFEPLQVSFGEEWVWLISIYLMALWYESLIVFALLSFWIVNINNLRIGKNKSWKLWVLKHLFEPTLALVTQWTLFCWRWPKNIHCNFLGARMSLVFFWINKWRIPEKRGDQGFSNLVRKKLNGWTC